MSDPFIGEIRIVGCNFAPRGWAFCNGQLLPIQQNTALFSLLGTQYGGNGTTTFGLPNLQGRVPLHAGGGQGPGLTSHELGETGGTETVTLLTTELPAHAHALLASSDAADTQSPAGASFAVAPETAPFLASGAAAAMSAQAVATAGGGQAHDNMPPVLALTFIIALQGIFPSRP